MIPYSQDTACSVAPLTYYYRGATLQNESTIAGVLTFRGGLGSDDIGH
jgi:hypothetical protein